MNQVEQDKDKQVTHHLNQVFQFLTHDYNENFYGFLNFIEYFICIWFYREKFNSFLFLVKTRLIFHKLGYFNSVDLI